MSEKVAILIDTGCDTPKSFMDNDNVFTLALKLNYGEELHDDLEFNPLEIYERFPKEIPTTSTPNMFEIQNLVDEIKAKGYEKIIAIGISSKLSGTINVIKTVLAQNEIEAFAFDTKNISIGSGFYAIWVKEMLDKGESYAKIVNALQNKYDDSDVFFYMDTLDYLKAGGRIGKVSASIGSVLKIKPIIACNSEGSYSVMSMIRGKKQSFNKMLEVVKEKMGNDEMWLAIMNGGAVEDAENMKNMILAELKNVKVIVDRQINPSLAIHTGPGLVGVGVFNPKMA